MPQSDTDYYFGHGMVWTAERTVAGAVPSWEPWTEVDSLTLNTEVENIQHISRRESIASKDLKIPSMIGLTGSMVVAQHSLAKLKYYLFGNQSTVTGGAFSAVSLGANVVAGQTVELPGNRKNVTSFSVVDSAMTPATLILGTDYEVDLAAGMLKFLNIGSYTQPFKVSGTEAAGARIGMLTQRIYELGLMFKGINIADGDKAVQVRLWKIQLDPADVINLLNSGTEVNTYTLNFEALKDTTVSNSITTNPLGQYGYIGEATA